MSCRSVPSRPTHLHSSAALAPSNSAIGVEAEVLTPGGVGPEIIRNLSKFENQINITSLECNTLAQ